MRGDTILEKKNKTQEMKEKLEYIGLNLDEIPQTLLLVEDLQFKPNVGIDEKKYRQYRYVSPKEIQILLSPTNRLDDVKEKYANASPLAAYLDPNSEDITKYLHGEEIKTDCKNGWAVVTVCGVSLGGAKVSNGVAKNHYPKGLRILK